MLGPDHPVRVTEIIDPISGELLARAGAGLGLALFATPLAGVLAFVDPGDAEPTNCRPVLAGARGSAQREKDGDKVSAIEAGAAKKKRKKFLGIF